LSIFSRDEANAQIIESLAAIGIQLICLRSTGYNHIDLFAAAEFNISVARVSAYSPEAIAEHTISMILALSRHLIKADRRIKQYNFSLKGLCGFNLGEKTVGVIGTGLIGSALIKILHGFGSRIIAHDIAPNMDMSRKYGVEYSNLEDLCIHSDIISLHIPLNKSTYHILNDATFSLMKEGVIVINTSRGDHINTRDLISYLKTGKISAAGLDVYHNEKEMENVLLTGHQAFLTETALSNIAETTFDNVSHFQNHTKSINFL